MGLACSCVFVSMYVYKGKVRLHRYVYLRRHLCMYRNVCVCVCVCVCVHVRRIEEVTPESLVILDLITPAPDLLVLGCGLTPKPLPKDVAAFLAERNMKVEVLNSVSPAKKGPLSHTYTGSHTHIHTYTHRLTHTHTHRLTHTNTHTYTYTHTYTHTHTHKETHMHTHTRTYAHTERHTHTHTRAHALMQVLDSAKHQAGLLGHLVVIPRWATMPST